MTSPEDIDREPSEPDDWSCIDCGGVYCQRSQCRYTRKIEHPPTAEEVRENIRLVAQAVHQELHDGPIEVCQRATCTQARELLGRGQ